MKKKIRLWVDMRDPETVGMHEWSWAKTYEEAISIFIDSNYEVIQASIEHDLTRRQVLGYYDDDEFTGYHLVSWMLLNDVFPTLGVRVHSANLSGSLMMIEVLKELCRKKNLPESMITPPIISIHIR